MDLFLALDVGGTKTAALLADQTRVLARASGGSIKTLRLASEEAATNLSLVLQALEAQAALSLRGRVKRTCIGTSGASAPGVRAWMQAAFADAIGGELLLLGDELIGLDAAFRGGRGVLAIAGTGSNIMGRAATGAMMHTGGWGPALSDEGSGHWLGTETLRACFRAIDAQPASSADVVSASGHRDPVQDKDVPPLLQNIMGALGLGQLDEVIGVGNAPGFVSASLVPVIVAAAREGDLLAAAMLRRAGEDLAGLVAAVIRKMELLERDTGELLAPPEVAFVGGILANIAEVHMAMGHALRRLYPEIVLQETAVDPLEGALWHARGAGPVS